jgi:hypothetical protein
MVAANSPPTTGCCLGYPPARDPLRVYAVVSSILLWLPVISRGWMKKFYFGFCTVGASSGLLRTAAGDQAFHAGIYIRVIMLVSPVLVGMLIVREHSREAAEYAEPSS